MRRAASVVVAAVADERVLCSLLCVLTPSLAPDL